MGFFESKEQKEFKKRQAIRRTMQQLKRHIQKLEMQKNSYIEKAKQARLKNMDSSYNVARSGLKATLIQLKKTEEMLLNIELITQYKDFAQVSSAFVKGMDAISNQLGDQSGKLDFAKLQQTFTQAMNKADTSAGNLAGLLESNEDTFAAMDSISDILDSEIDSLVGSEAANAERDFDTRIDKLLDEARHKGTKTPAAAAASAPNTSRSTDTPKTPAQQPAAPPAAPQQPAQNGADQPQDDVEFDFSYYPDFKLPETSLLGDYAISDEDAEINRISLEQDSRTIEQTLAGFGIAATVAASAVGPTFTRFEVSLQQGQKVAEIAKIEDDLSMALECKVRLQLPIIGKNVFGIEVANRKRAIVGLKNLYEKARDQFDSNGIKFVLGADITFDPVIKDMTKLIHMLIGGSTGSGKSTFIHTLLLSILFNYTPNDVKLLLFDFKRVELNRYNGLPNLLTKTIIDSEIVAMKVFEKLVKLMNDRYDILNAERVRSIAEYNEKYRLEPSKHMPKVLVVVDECADLMNGEMGKIFTRQILTLSQKARGSGIHLILATQRPSVDVIIGTIKANFPTQLAFRVPRIEDSRTILGGETGAQNLLGDGDLLFNEPQAQNLKRLQAPFADTWEIDAVTNRIVQLNPPIKRG